jgi:carbamoyltransferase
MVKHREWFRPFAATVLEERANDWFELEGLPDSSFMSYAVNVLPEKSKLVPAITHVDNTCRVQTVRHDQNQHYYDLISKFYTISGVPMLFNTSFNLAGMPLVDTLQDAVETFVRSDIPYLYLPEIKIILEKQ